MELLQYSDRASSIALVLSAFLALLVPAEAQTLSAFVGEGLVAQGSFLPSLTSNLPANVLASITAGTLQIHEQTNYNPLFSELTSTFFLMPAGSTLPTILSSIPVGNILAIVSLTADRIYVTNGAVQFAGTITKSSALGSTTYLGLPASFSFGYTSDTPPKIYDVIDSFASVGVVYIASATGTVAVTQPNGGGGGSGGLPGIKIAVSGPGAAIAPYTFQAVVNQITLDASQSTSSNPPLTFLWTVAPSYAGAAISGGTTATPLFTLTSGHLVYQFILTVTDAAGATATATITVIYS
jgi:hypothetical protein